MERRLILAGIGGQGVIYATRVISQAALARGERVMASENHGMSQRGGSVQAHLKIGGGESPLIRRGTADGLIALDRVEAVRNLAYIRAGGAVAVNTTDGLNAEVLARLDELGVEVLCADADAVARELGNPAVTNLVLLGFAAVHGALGLTVEDLGEAVRRLGPARAVDLNLRALRAGADLARASRRPSAATDGE